MDETTSQIIEGLKGLGLPVGAEVALLLATHLQMVYETNRELNLTAIPENAGVVLHVLDSAAALPYLNKAPQGPFADLGSGAGFPGVTLAALSGREVALVESVRKKAAFLERVVEALRLKATVHPVRAEELADERRAGFAAVTARALSALPSLVELASPLLEEGGLLVCLKGEPEEAELRRGDVAGALCGMKRIATERVSVPGADAVRTMVVYERSGTPKTRLPRRNGMAQRQPLA